MTNWTASRGFPLGRHGAWLLGLWSLFLLFGFVVAYHLQPDPRGYGTHQRLGLPPCTFRTVFDIPCPSCGMTTSISNFVHGRFLDSARANVGGLLLAMICLVQIPWCWLSIYSGRMWRIARPEVAALWLLSVLFAVCAVQWIARLVLLSA